MSRETNKSDKYGRALEYIITKNAIEELSEKRIKLNYNKNNIGKDKEKYESLKENEKKEYLKTAKIVTAWLVGNFVHDYDNILVDRLTDNNAKKGNIADIVFDINSEHINLSIKHNHDALKHQRPSATAQQCGYEKGSAEDKQFRQEYASILENVMKRIQKDFRECSNFEEIKLADANFIDENIYRPICDLVLGYINSNCQKPENADELFRFLYGTIKYFKIIDLKNEIHIYEFDGSQKVNKVEARQNMNEPSYVYLTFSNGWKASMRLHTASKDYGYTAKGKPDISIKFDTRPIDLDVEVPKIIIDKNIP